MTRCHPHSEVTEKGLLRVTCDPCGSAPTSAELAARDAALESLNHTGELRGNALGVLFDVTHREDVHRPRGPVGERPAWA